MAFCEDWDDIASGVVVIVAACSGVGEGAQERIGVSVQSRMRWWEHATAWNGLVLLLWCLNVSREDQDREMFYSVIVECLEIVFDEREENGTQAMEV